MGFNSGFKGLNAFVTFVSTVQRIVIRQSDVFFSGYFALNIKTPGVFETTDSTEMVKCDKSRTFRK